MYRKEAIIHRMKPEALDDPLTVTAPHGRLFTMALLVLLAIMAGWVVLAV